MAPLNHPAQKNDQVDSKIKSWGSPTCSRRSQSYTSQFCHNSNLSKDKIPVNTRNNQKDSLWHNNLLYSNIRIQLSLKIYVDSLKKKKNKQYQTSNNKKNQFVFFFLNFFLQNQNAINERFLKGRVVCNPSPAASLQLATQYQLLHYDSSNQVLCLCLTFEIEL